MKKTMMRSVTFVIALIMLASMQVFAQGQDEEKVDQLTMYLIGEPHRDTDLMLEELNGYMREDIGAELDVIYLPWGDWRTKYPLLFASGEEFDLIFTADWAFFFRETRDGAFLNISDMLETVTPDLYEFIPQEAWDQAWVQGGIHMVPCNNPEYDGYGFLYRKDLAIKYGLDPEIDSLEELGVFLEAVKENEEGMIPYNAGSWDLRLIELMYSGLKPNNMLPLISEDWNVFVSMNDLDGDVIVDELEPEFVEFAEVMREWQQKGFWSKNVMSNPIGSRDAFENGTSAIALCNTVNNNNLYKTTSERYPDWDFGYFDFYADKDARLIFPYISNGTAINRNSKYPEKALQLLEKLHMDERYYRLTQYGIEGKHYEIDDQGRIGLAEGLDPAESWSFTAWGWTQYEMSLPSKDDWELWLDLNDKYSGIRALNPIGDFSFDEAPVENEMAAVANVMAQYKTPLYWGLVETEKGYAELQDKLDKAGYQKIIAEAEKQYRAFRAEQ